MEEAKKKFSPLKAIRRYCLGCSNGSSNEVKLCTVTSCELYEYRSGHNPYRKGKGGNPEHFKNARSTNDSEAEAEGVEEVTD